MRHFTVGELQKQLDSIVDKSAIVVVPGYDHSYRAVRPGHLAQAEMTGYDYLSEYDGPIHMYDTKNKIVNVFVIGE